MLEITANLNRQLLPVFFPSQSNPLVFSHICNSFTLKKCVQSPCYRSVSCSLYKKVIKASAARKEEQKPQLEAQKGIYVYNFVFLNIFFTSAFNLIIFSEGWSGSEDVDLGWFPSFPHVLVASMSNFLFGYHIG